MRQRRQAPLLVLVLGAALLQVLPEAFESHVGAHQLFLTLLRGLLFFFLLDKAELYRHTHHHEGDGHHHHHHFDAEQAGRGGWSVLVGDGTHNFCDGIIAAAAFLTYVNLGLVTALANAGLQYRGMLFSVFYGVTLFGEHLSWMAFAGMLLIVAAGLAATVPGRAPAAAKAPPER